MLLILVVCGSCGSYWHMVNRHPMLNHVQIMQSAVAWFELLQPMWSVYLKHPSIVFAVVDVTQCFAAMCLSDRTCLL